MKSFILSLLFLFILSSSLGWTAGPTYEKQYEGNGFALVEKQVGGFVQMNALGVFNDADELLMVEIHNVDFLLLPGFPSLDPSLEPLELLQCFPEDRVEEGIFIREASCNNGYGTTLCPGTTCIGYFIYTDDEGQSTGRTHLSILSLDKENKEAKGVWFHKLDGEELFNVVGIVKEKE